MSSYPGDERFAAEQPNRAQPPDTISDERVKMQPPTVLGYRKLAVDPRRWNELLKAEAELAQARAEAEQLRRERDEVLDKLDAARAALAERERAAFMAGWAHSEHARMYFARFGHRSISDTPDEAYAAWQATQPATPSEREP